MKVSLSWLKEYVPVKLSHQEISDTLTMAGLEVDSYHDRYDFMDTVVISRIVEIAQHPNADKLRCCKVDVGEEELLSIVCGAPNARQGLVVPCAKVGTEFPGGLVIKKSKLRGERSEGMLCSASELGIGDGKAGIMELDENLTPGTPVAEALNLSDATFEIDLTPNRPDCLSLIGTARELASIQKEPLTPPCEPMPEADPALGTIKDHTSVTIEDADLCPRYAARLVMDVKVAPSPFWLQDRLLSVGLTPINNIVDITNFVMMETGQPLHAFDFDRLEGQRIVVKAASEGETFTTLDSREHKLNSATLMICDAEKPVAVAGVMGGLNSEIEETTTKVLIESAYFNPVTVRKAAKLIATGTDASHRFERGVDPEGTIVALERAAQLITQLGEGRLVDGIIDERPKMIENSPISFTADMINRRLGTSLSGEEMITMLGSVGFTVTADGEKLITTPPSFRVDLSRPEDISEEIARLWGYNNIETTFARIPSLKREQDPRIMTRNGLKRILSGMGMTEAINYSFISEKSCDRLELAENDPRRNTATIINPLSEELSVLRSSLVPGMLETMRRNNSRQVSDLMMFECGKAFVGSAENTQPEETEYLTGLITGNVSEKSWNCSEKPCDFFDLKGILEGFFSTIKMDSVRYTSLEAGECPYLKPGYGARIIAGSGDGEVTIGVIGEVHPTVAANFELRQTAFIFELNLELLMPAMPGTPQSRPTPKYPSITRDITIIVKKEVEAHSILTDIRSLQKEVSLIESVSLLDLYEGEKVPEGKKSLSFRFVYRSPDKTLKDKAINKTHTHLSSQILKRFDAELPA